MLRTALLIALGLASPANGAFAQRASRAVARDSAALATLLRATRAVEGDSAKALEARWVRSLTSAPANKEALLGLSTIARLNNRFERADSLAHRLLGQSNAAAPLNAPVDDYAVLARVAVASLIVGRTPQRADSVLRVAQLDAQALQSPRLESSVLVSLAVLRSRSVGARASIALLEESRRKYPDALPPEEAARLCYEANYGAIVGDRRAEDRLQEGIALARSSRSWRVFAECRTQQSLMLEKRGNFARSLEMMDEAALWLRRLHADAPLSAVLQRSAYVRVQQGDLARARKDYIDAIECARRARNASAEAWSYGGLGEIAIALNDYSGARQYLDVSMTMHKAANDRWGVAAVQYLQAERLDAIGDVQGARELLLATVEMYVSTQQSLLAIAPLRRLARIDLAENRPADAERSLNRATQLATATRNSGWFAELPFHKAGVALARGQLDLADSLLRQMNTSFSQADIAYSYWIRRAEIEARRENFEATERAMDSAMVVLTRWRQSFTEKDVRLRIAEARRSWGSVGAEYIGLIARLARAGRVASAFGLSEASRARELATVSLQQAAASTESNREALAIQRLSASHQSAALHDVQQALDDSTAMIAYVAGRGESPTTAFVITRRSATWTVLPPVDSLAGDIDRFLRLSSDGVDASALARRLGDAILQPVVTALPPTATRLVLVPELSFYRVPFDALQLADGRYAVERFSTTIVPSASQFVASSKVRTVNSGSLLAFGDAVFAEHHGAHAVSGNSRGETEFPRLPASGAEARRIAKYATASTVLTRSMASERALRTAAMRNVGIMHLATHAIVDDRSLQRSVLALTPTAGYDGSVTPDELGAPKLNRTLVVLSGCKTAGGVILSGEGLRGFVMPLLEAGAATVVATQWAIGDAAILPMIDRFYWHAAQGVDAATAMRRARLDAIRGGVKPAVWASLTLVGDGRLRVALRQNGMAPLDWDAK